jgi:hypothetical protein
MYENTPSSSQSSLEEPSLSPQSPGSSLRTASFRWPWEGLTPASLQFLTPLTSPATLMPNSNQYVLQPKCLSVEMIAYIKAIQN